MVEARPAVGPVAEIAAPDPVTLVREAAANPVQGARAKLGRLTAQTVSLGGVADAALRQNYGIAASAEAAGSARALVTQREAAFDLNLNSAVAYTGRKTRDRVDLIGRERTQSVDPESLAIDTDDDGIPDFVEPSTADKNPCINIDGDLIDSGAVDGLCSQTPIYSVFPEWASWNSRSLSKVTGSVGLSKIFSFGGSASVSLSSTWNEKYFLTAPPQTFQLTPTDRFGWGDKRFWTSSAALSTALPLPYTKGFGTAGSPESFSLALAQSGDRRAGFSQRAVRNSTLSEVLQRYWDLIRSVQDIRTLVALKAVLNERYIRAQRLVDSGTFTNYELGQIQTELVNFDLREETAWTQYRLASSSLLPLLAAKGDTVLVPGDVDALLAQPVPAIPADVYRRALENNPEIRVQQEDLDASKVTVAFRDNQTNPDVDLIFTLSATQNDSTFGYTNPARSTWKLSKPDRTDLFIGVRYILPLGNQAVKNALTRARIDEQNAFDRSLQTRQRIVNAVDRALADIRGAEAQIVQNETDLELARLAFERVVEERDRGFASEFEVTNRYQDVLTARLNQTAAQVALRKAHIRLAAAEGALEQEVAR
jgi:outer membrane protein TolC